MATKTIKKTAKLKKPWNAKNVLLDFDKNFERLKYWCFKIFDLCLMISLKTLNKILNES